LDSTNSLEVFGFRSLMWDLRRCVRTFPSMRNEVKEMGQFQLATSSWCLSAWLLLFWKTIGQLK